MNDGLNAVWMRSKRASLFLVLQLMRQHERIPECAIARPFVIRSFEGEPGRDISAIRAYNRRASRERTG
jgi:hypothetical protein